MSHAANHVQSFADPTVAEPTRDGKNPTHNSSPARYKRNTVDSTLTFTLADARGALRDTMRGKIDIPPSIEEFMELFVKDYHPVLEENIFAKAPTFSTETDMYEYITDTINNSSVVDSSKLVCASTPYKSDRNDATRQAVDLGLYPTRFKPINEGDGEYNRRINWSRIDLSIECKVGTTEQDPFDETADDLLPTAGDRKKALGQILTYVENVFIHQHCTFHYMILFLGHCARIVRFDHSGVYATIKFNYKTDGAILTTFLSRYSQYDMVARGYDPTATRLERRNPLVKQMREFGDAAAVDRPDDHAQQEFNKSLINASPWYKLEVHDQSKGDVPDPVLGQMHSSLLEQVTRSFVVGKPNFEAGGVVGRGTRGYVAVEVDATGTLFGPFVYLKDAWRVDHDGIEQEGSVLKELNRHEVPFVPSLVCHGDLKGQVTKSQDAWDRRQVKHPGLKRTFKKHQHYRLVVSEVGKPLEDFTSGARLVTAIYCCLFAHQVAYEKAGIIHRDISSGNILLHQAPNGVWKGLLNDWELSKKVNSSTARQPDRTGTWQFMSARALNDPNKDITIEDEIEAFFHVLLYHAVRFLPHNIEPNGVPQFLADYFDGCCVKGDEYGCGLAKMAAMRTGEIDLTAYNSAECSLMFVNPGDKKKAHYIDALISRLLISFKAAYARNPSTREYVRSKKSESLKDFFAMLGTMPHAKPAAAPVASSRLVKTRSKGKKKVSPKPSRRHERKAVSSVTTTAAAAATSSSFIDDRTPISLKEHGPVVELFFQCMALEGWPSDDKGDDLRGKTKVENTYREVPIYTGGEDQSKSKKRPLDNPPPAPSTSKRSRA